MTVHAPFAFRRDNRFGEVPVRFVFPLDRVVVGGPGAQTPDDLDFVVGRLIQAVGRIVGSLLVVVLTQARVVGGVGIGGILARDVLQSLMSRKGRHCFSVELAIFCLESQFGLDMFFRVVSRRCHRLHEQLRLLPHVEVGKFFEGAVGHIASEGQTRQRDEHESGEFQGQFHRGRAPRVSHQRGLVPIAANGSR